jgi:hypothetical protein
MAPERPYAELTEDQLRAQVLRPDRRLPPPNEAKALLDEWVLRQAREQPSVERASSPSDRGQVDRPAPTKVRSGPDPPREQATPARSMT